MTVHLDSPRSRHLGVFFSSNQVPIMWTVVEAQPHYHLHSFWIIRKVSKANTPHVCFYNIHWKADAPKTSHCLVWILVQRNNWAIFLRIGPCCTKCTKIEEEDIGNIWFQQDGVTCYTAEDTRNVLRCGAAVWHRWTIIFEVPSKIRGTSTS